MDKKSIISCGIYLFRSDNKLLIGHPTGFKSNIWAIPKGRMNDDESDYFEVAKRELKEETGLDLNDLNIVSMKEFETIRYRETNKYLKSFFIKVSNDLFNVDINCESMVYRNGQPAFPEFDDFRWVNIKEAEQLLHEFQHLNLNRCLSLISESNNLKYLKQYRNF